MMQAVINISQEGTKLRPLSCNKCPAMLKLCDCTVIGKLIEQLKKSNVKSIVLVAGYMAREVREYLKSGEAWGVEITYVSAQYSDNCLKTHSDILEDEFIYFAKTVYTDMDFSKVMKFHREKNAYITIASSKGEESRIICDKEGRITRIEEKRLWHSVTGTMGAGIYVLNKDVVKFIPENLNADIFENVLPAVVRAGKNVYYSTYDAVCENIHDLASYMRSNFSYLDSLKKINKKGILIEEDAKVEKGALIEGPCYVGHNARIMKGARVGAYSSIGRGALICQGASVKRSCVGDGCKVGAGVNLRGCVLDSNVVLGENVSVFEQAVIGFGTKIDEGSKIKSFVKIWPEKCVEKNLTVNENIMWGQKKRAHLYNKGVIEGVVNSDITPKFCAALGEAIGALFDMSEVGVSNDGSPVGSMIRDGIVSGLVGAGSRVKDFGEQPLPITRRGVNFYSLKGAVDINVWEKSGEYVAQITVIDSHGIDIDNSMRARLEDLFEKGAYNYARGRSIFECEYHFEYKLYYLKSLVGGGRGKCKGKKLLVSCPATWGRRLIASAMGDFNCSVSMYDSSDETFCEKSFAEAVNAGGFDMGFILDSKCEKLTVVLDDKQIIADEVYEALSMLIVMKKHKNAKIYVPVTSSATIDMLGQKYSCELVRTKDASRELMRSVTGEDKAKDDQFIFRFDAVGAIIKLIDFLTDHDIYDLLKEIPPIIMAREIVEVPGEEIAKALRRIRNIKGADKNAPEGVKITLDKGWVAVVPDIDKEVFKVVSESVSVEAARELCNICIEKIRKR